MLDQLFGAFLFLFGLSGSGSVRGESTPSAIASISATAATSSGTNIPTSAKTFIPNNIGSLQAKFQEKHQQAVSAMEAKRASFTASLQAIKDEKKKVILETIQTHLTEINQNQTTHMMTKLKQLNVGVEEMYKLSQKYVQDSGKDLSAVTSSLVIANETIADGISTVTAQAEKTYVVSISSETKAKNDVGKVRNQLASDLKKARDAVSDARKKTGEALKALKSAIGKPVMITVQSTAEITVPSDAAYPTP